MPETPLSIEWPYQAINVDEAQSNAIIVRDPLSVASKMLGYATPSEERKKRYQPRVINRPEYFLSQHIPNPQSYNAYAHQDAYALIVILLP